MPKVRSSYEGREWKNDLHEVRRDCISIREY